MPAGTRLWWASAAKAEGDPTFDLLFDALCYTGYGTVTLKIQGRPDSARTGQSYRREGADVHDKDALYDFVKAMLADILGCAQNKVRLTLGSDNIMVN